MTPELSSSLVPPKVAKAISLPVTETPSIWSCAGLPAGWLLARELIVALPRMMMPPQRPTSLMPRLPLRLSSSEVKMIGALAVPSAMIFEPRVMMSAAAPAPVETLPLITVPASMVRVALLITKV
jgi:hypothetical protein